MFGTFLSGLTTAGRFLPPLHPEPVQKAIEIVDQEYRKADQDQKIGAVLCRGQPPEYDQDQVVGGIGGRKQGAAPKGQEGGQEAGGHGQSAGDQAVGVERSQDEIKHCCDCHGQGQHPSSIPSLQPSHLDLGPVSLIWIPQPGDQSEYRHWRSHSQVGRHLSIIPAGERNDTVQRAEAHHQQLSEGVPLGVEDQGGHADQRRGQDPELCPVIGEEEGQDERGGRPPERQFPPGKIVETVIHTFFCHI